MIEKLEGKVKRNLSLDVLKILACFSVVILHVFGRKMNIGNSMIYYMATFAIPIFFMVNGFLLMNKEVITYQYVMKKIIRMIVVIIVWNIIIALGNFVIKQELINPIIESIKNLIQQGTFYQFWFFGSLMLLYSILPKLHKWLKENKRTYQIVLITLFFICIAIDVINIIWGIRGEEIITSKIIQTFRLWTWLFYFLLGGYIGKYDLEIKYKERLNFKAMGIMIISFVILYQYLIGKYIFKDFHAEYFYDNIFIMLYSVLIFKGMLSKKCEKYHGMIEKISNCIMGIYILHPFIIRLIGKFYNYENTMVNLFVLLLTIGMSMLISIIITKIPKLKKMITI